jgi:hypothetical protein
MLDLSAAEHNGASPTSAAAPVDYIEETPSMDIEVTTAPSPEALETLSQGIQG